MAPANPAQASAAHLEANDSACTLLDKLASSKDVGQGVSQFFVNKAQVGRF